MTLVYWSYWIQKNAASAQGHEVSFCMFYTSSPLTKHYFQCVVLSEKLAVASSNHLDSKLSLPLFGYKINLHCHHVTYHVEDTHMASFGSRGIFTSGNRKFWPILQDSFIKNWTLKKNVIKRKKEKNLIVRIMKIGENCEESWSCLSYTALDLVVWFERSEEVMYMIAKVIFLQSCIQVQYELKARNSNCAQIWSLSSKNLHKTLQ